MREQVNTSRLLRLLGALLFSIIVPMGCEENRPNDREEDKDAASLYDQCSYVGLLDETACVAELGGYSFSADAVQLLGGEDLGGRAIRHLPNSVMEEDGVSTFLFSLGLHVLLDGEKTPKFIVSTSAAPRIEVYALKSVGCRYEFDMDSPLVARGRSTEYFRELADCLDDLIEDPIALEQLEILKDGTSDGE